MSTFRDGNPLDASVLDAPTKLIDHPETTVPIPPKTLSYESKFPRPQRGSFWSKFMRILRRLCFALGLGMFGGGMSVGIHGDALAMSLGLFLAGLCIPLGKGN